MTALRNATLPKTFTQTLILCEKGYILRSCDSIFSTQNFTEKSIDKWSPFLTSIFETLISLPYQKILIIPKINSVADNVEGFYDCSFEKKIDKKHGNIIVWCMEDVTLVVEERRKIQQANNAVYFIEQ